MAATDLPTSLRLADLLAPLSLVADLGMGFPPEHAARACLLATGLARRMDVPEGDVAEIYYTTLLRHIGCTAYAHEQSVLVGGDDNATRAAQARVDFADIKQLLSFMVGLGKGQPPLRGARTVASAMAAGRRWGREITAANCEVATAMARRLGLGESVQRALYENLERWDGKGGPKGQSGEDIALAARFAQLADQALLFHSLVGQEAASETIGARAGGMLDPSIAGAFLEYAEALFEDIAEADPIAALTIAEPEPHRTVSPRQLDDAARAFADMADLKTPFTHGHSSGVAELAESAARRLSLGEDAASVLRQAGLFHDLGRVGVPTGIWEKPGSLTTGEWERVRLHPYHTERILSRSPVLSHLAPLAGMHHERNDGSGYHRQARAAAIPMGARILAAADSYQAMTQNRPHRSGLSPEVAAKELSEQVRQGRLDDDAAGAVLTAAGQGGARSRQRRPAGLSDREVEVLRLVAEGLPTKEVARRLYISSKTAEHHIEHIYTKIGVSSRAAAAMFAMEHDLLSR